MNLPADVTHTPDRPRPAEQIVLEYTVDRNISINKQQVTRQELAARLRAIFAERRDRTMFIIGDGSLRYGEIVQVIDSARGAGVEQVGIVTERMRSRPGGG